MQSPADERHSPVGLSALRLLLLSFICAAAFLCIGLVYGEQSPGPPAAFIGALTSDASTGYAGSNACAQCHASQVIAWRGSQHSKAMQIASKQSVSGDFDNARAEHFDSRARFFQKYDRYFMETDGVDGTSAEFEIAYTFGVEPLQQYLTQLPDGRVQALPFAFDTRPKSAGGQRWFHLYPDQAIPAGDALHWTGAQQNWNFMCADCHSTDVWKNYDAKLNRFSTTFSEISVGCESCHGPASGHIAWAKQGKHASSELKGFESIAAKRATPDWTPDPVTGSPAHGVARPVGGELDTCGVCHTRRLQFAEGWRPGKPLADFYRPALLTPDLFELDGQMRDEVFNLSSFQQSKMHAKGVVCSDCHDPHSGKVRASGSAVCAQCHLPEKFDTISHSGHKTSAGQPDCISCHMPSRTFMVVDARHDHSFRIPRPDLSVSLGTPNACNDCHNDKPAAWASSAIEQWHGPNRKGFQTYAPAFHAASTDHPEARRLLLEVANNNETPSLARATALTLLKPRPSRDTLAAATQAFQDADPIVRIAALDLFEALPHDQRWRQASKLLMDPVRAVRIQAAFTLAEGAPASASQSERDSFKHASAEFIAAERFNADRADARTRLARFYARQGKAKEAEEEYLAALNLDASISPRVDLADFYRAFGREADSEALLRQTIAMEPLAAAPQHALGLAMIRAKRYQDALGALKQAHELEPTQARYSYVYAIALESMGRTPEALHVLQATLQNSPSNVDTLRALLRLYLASRDYANALGYTQRLAILLPDDASLAPLVKQLQQRQR
jgi:tetratricopeptide (TPR) repeat protein